MQVKNYKLTDETVTEIGKFTILWSLFEKNKCQNNCNASTIKDALKQITYDDHTVNNLADVLKQRRIFFSKDIIDYVNENLHPIGARISKPDDLNSMCDFLKQDSESLYGCLLIIYRIRNNLLHGLKQIEDLDKQLPLFKAVNEVLESIK